MPILLSGRPIAAELRRELRAAVEALPQGPPVRLLVVRIGEDPASEQYVRGMERAAAEIGITVERQILPPGTPWGEFLKRLAVAARRDDVDGVQIQKPLPSGRSAAEALHHVAPEKDVEGLHPENVGLLVLGRPRFVPATPAAVMRLLDHHRIGLAGRRAVILGRSDIVGKPLAALLLARDATVTICHRATRDVAEQVRHADLLVAATGAPELVKADWLRPQTVVIDVGHNVLPDGRTVGDVEAAAREHAAAWSPVPGGVGPLTVIELLRNVVEAAKARRA